MRIIFLGTPEFAVPTLEKLLSWPQGEVVAVVTQPDRPAGRGKHIFAPPTKLVAQAHNIPVLQPEKLSKAPDVVQAMRDLNPDVLITAAFGQILKKEVLTMAKFGVVNLHGSLLPKYRGAAPINWAVINGETETGNTTMFSDVGIDTGEMLLMQKIPIGPDTTAEELAATLSIIGADLVIDTLERLLKGDLQGTKQDDSLATFAPRLTKEMGEIDWRKSAHEIHNLVRGLVPWPGAFINLGEKSTLKVWSTRRLENDTLPGRTATTNGAGNGDGTELHGPGTIILDGKHIYVTCGIGNNEVIELIEVQPPNKSRMKALDWVHGARLKTGTPLAAH